MKTKKRKQVRHVEKFLKANGLKYQKPNPSHLKLAFLNYWPTTGRIYIDKEDKSERKRGFKAFKEILSEIGFI